MWTPWLLPFLAPSLWPVYLPAPCSFPGVCWNQVTLAVSLSLDPHHKLSTVAPHSMAIGCWCWLSWTWVHCVSLDLQHRLLAFLWRSPLGDLTQFLSVITQQFHPNPSLWLEEHCTKKSSGFSYKSRSISIKAGLENLWKQEGHSSITCQFAVASLLLWKGRENRTIGIHQQMSHCSAMRSQTCPQHKPIWTGSNV